MQENGCKRYAKVGKNSPRRELLDRFCTQNTAGQTSLIRQVPGVGITIVASEVRSGKQLLILSSIQIEAEAYSALI